MRTALVTTTVVGIFCVIVAGCSSELVKFNEPHGIYSVGMPGTPEQVMVRTDAKEGRWLSLFLYEAYPGFFSSSDAQYYKVGHGRMEHTGETAPTTEDIEKALMELSQMGGVLKVKKNVPVPFDGYSVRDLTLVGAASESVVRTYVKVTPEDNFIYMMEIQFVEGDVNQAELDAFLGSFQLGPEAGKTPKNLNEERIPDWLKKKQ